MIIEDNTIDHLEAIKSLSKEEIGDFFQKRLQG